MVAAKAHRGRDGRPCGGEVEVEHTLGALLDKHPRGRWTLQGDPGAGKSTQLRHLAIQRARRARARLEAGEDIEPGTVPIVVSLPELAERLEEGVTVFDLVADEVTSTVGYRELKRDRLRAELDRLANAASRYCCSTALTRCAPNCAETRWRSCSSTTNTSTRRS